jgi:hypothetical protein
VVSVLNLFHSEPVFEKLNSVVVIFYCWICDYVIVIVQFLVPAMNIMGLTDQEQSNILQAVAGVLHLGNITFVEKGNYSEIRDQNGEHL